MKGWLQCNNLHTGVGSWAGAGGANSTGDDWSPTVTKEEFYVSGQNAQFTVINGVYSPTITMTVPPHLSRLTQEWALRAKLLNSTGITLDASYQFRFYSCAD